MTELQSSKRMVKSLKLFKIQQLLNTDLFAEEKNELDKQSIFSEELEEKSSQDQKKLTQLDSQFRDKKDPQFKPRISSLSFLQAGTDKARTLQTQIQQSDAYLDELKDNEREEKKRMVVENLGYSNMREQYKSNYEFLFKKEDPDKAITFLISSLISKQNKFKKNI